MYFFKATLDVSLVNSGAQNVENDGAVTNSSSKIIRTITDRSFLGSFQYYMLDTTSGVGTLDNESVSELSINVSQGNKIIGQMRWCAESEIICGEVPLSGEFYPNGNSSFPTTDSVYAMWLTGHKEWMFNLVKVSPLSPHSHKL